jgi:hypothetical protein
MTKGPGEKFDVVFSFAVVVTDTQLLGVVCLLCAIVCFTAVMRMAMVACRQHVGCYPAWKSAWNRVLMCLGIALYVVSMYSNPMQCGLGPLVEQEDFMAF